MIVNGGFGLWGAWRTASETRNIEKATALGVKEFGAIGILGGDKCGEGTVGFLQVTLGDAEHVGFAHILDAVAHEEHEAPITLRVILAEIERDGLHPAVAARLVFAKQFDDFGPAKVREQLQAFDAGPDGRTIKALRPAVLDINNGGKAGE